MSDSDLSKGEATRQAILQEAVRIASVDGLEGLSIGGLSKHLGLSKSGLFGHFRSKENLQIQVLHAGRDIFVDNVVRPAVKAPRGLPRVQALFDQWLQWAATSKLPGGCLFVAVSVELDDRPGPLRDVVVHEQELWIQTIDKAAAIAVDEGHFRADLDTRQFAFEMHAVLLGCHHFFRLLDDKQAFERGRAAFARLMSSAQNS